VRITLKLFAAVAERAGARSLELHLPAGATVALVRTTLRQTHPQLPWLPGTMLAVNQQYAQAADLLRDGDEVAVIPPVSGG
jgi:MoaE-MoaD fusion protein